MIWKMDQTHLAATLIKRLAVVGRLHEGQQEPPFTKWKWQARVTSNGSLTFFQFPAPSQSFSPKSRSITASTTGR
jgi:hypothetical protein